MSSPHTPLSFDLGFFSFDEPAPAGPSSSESSPVVVVDADRTVSEYLAGLLTDAAAVSSMAELEARLGPSPIVAVLGPSCGTPHDLALVEQWSRSRPSQVAVVLVASQVSTELLHGALRAGVKDVLAAPVDKAELLEAVSRTAEALRGVPAGAAGGSPIGGDGAEPARVITVFSTKGGSGKSVVATNVAAALARRSERPVALVDAHLQFGDVAVMLRLHPQHTVVDAVQSIDQLDPGLLRELMSVHHPSGLLVLPAPLEPSSADQISGSEVVRILEVLRSFCGSVVVDTPASFNEVVLSIIEHSDDVLLVSGMDIPSIKNVKVGLSTLAMLATPSEKLHLVLNRAGSATKLGVAEIERTLHVSTLAHLPADAAVPSSIERGMPVVLSAPRSGVARSLEALASRFSPQSAAPPSRRKLFG